MSNRVSLGEKPECQLTGKDGNVFAIIGEVKRVLVDYGLPDLADEFVKRATNSSSYEEVLSMIDEYVEVS